MWTDGRWRGKRVAGGVVAIVIVAAAALGIDELLGQGGGPGPGPPRPAGAGASTAPPPSGPAVRPTVGERPLTAEEQAFAQAYVELAETHDRAAVDLLIANPLAEYDLVGARLVDLVEDTRSRLAGLPPLALVAGPLRDLRGEVAATADLLRAIDPHGPRRGELATDYRHALDYWVEHVQSLSDEIRAALGLPPLAPGDLRL